MSLGDAIAVAKANIKGCTVGNVDIAPLEREYGSGHRRIMTSNFNPSCFKVSASAANRLSVSTSRWAKPDRRLRDTTNEQKEPTTVAEATTNQLLPTSQS